MRILLVNQTYLPDLASTAQHLGDLARRLAQRGHEVRVIASARCYEDPSRTHPRHEFREGVQIRRIGTSGFGKGARWRRIADSIGFFGALLLTLLTEPKPDVAVSLTSPPLLPVLVAAIARLRGIRFVYWAMDLNPEEAIALGYLRADSAIASALLRLAGWAFRQADPVIALDAYVAAHIEQYGVAPARVVVLPPWAHYPAAPIGTEPNRFRLRYDLGDSFVVMYSGNHSPCHPLDTLLGAALQLRDEPDIVFCFVGGGSGKAQVQAFRDQHRLRSILDIPYQPF
jgi:glycosyltransferase involved in cell wall biosynthesis